jgi:CubicO group peptidase (beta-lactamase class C family)
MTALIAAMLVEAGSIKWSSTVSEVFSELEPSMDAGVRGVTQRQS